MRRISILTVMTILVLSMVLAACGSNSSKDSGTSPNSGSTAEQPKQAGSSGDKTKLTVWKFGGTPAELDFYKQKVGEFNSQSKDVAVEWTNLPFQGKREKIIGAYKTNSLPDVVVLDAQSIPDFTGLGVIQALDDADKASADKWKGNFVPEIWDAVHYNNKLYGVPFFADVAPMLTLNTKILKDAGYVDGSGNVLPPKNWDEVIAYAKKMTTSDHYGMILPATNNLNDINMFEGLMYGNGGSWLTADEKQVGIDNPGVLDTLKFYKDLKASASISPGFAESNYLDAVTQFLQGKGAMILTMTWVGAIEKQVTKEKSVDYVVLPFPKRSTISGTLPPVGSLISPTTTIMMTKTTKHSKQAMAFIDFWTNPDNQKCFADGTCPGRIPALKASFDNPAFQKNNPEIYKAYKDGTLFKGAIHMPWFTGLTEMEPLLANAYQSVLQGKQSPEEALKQLSDQSKKVFK